MPARNVSRKNVKSRTRPKRSYKSRRDLAKYRRKTVRVRTNPRSAPNAYHFTRGYDSVGFVDANTGIFRQNTDNKYLIISLATAFNELPDFAEFNSLFSEYKIKGFSVTLTPNFSMNQYQTLTSTDTVARTDIRNYQCFAVPVNFVDEYQDFSQLSGPSIDKWLNCTQRKKVAVFPGYPKTYHTTRPQVVKYDSAVSKETHTNASTKMGRPTWYSTAAPPLVQVDERTVKHYGMRLLIRRVDGGTMNPSANPMGWRVHHQVHFACRKVQ